MLELANPFPPASYFLHTIIGTLGVLLAVVALAVAKGSRPHVAAGRGFTAAATIAAATAVHFSFTEPSPLAISSSLMMFGLLLGAVLALRAPTARVRFGEWTATALMALAWLVLVLLGAFGLAAWAGLLTPPPGQSAPPLLAVLPPLAYAVFPTWFLLDDLRFRRPGARQRPRAIGRHFSRMAFALAIAVHAPLVSFADDLGIPGWLAFFGPFLLWPLLLAGFRNHPLLRQGRPPSG